MDLGLKNKVIIVTGGAKGIGRSICLTLAQEGAVPVIVGRNRADNEKVLDEIVGGGGQAFIVNAELTNPEDCQRAVQETLSKWGKIDGLVNNAGLNDGVSLENGNYDDFVESLHRNVIHYFLMAHHALAELKKNQGVIVNISSKTADVGQGGTSGYAASNGGRNALTREWAVELSKYGIRVNAVVVSECWTPQYEKWIKKVSETEAQAMQEITEKIPLGNRMTTSEEIADTVTFLLSDRSSHTTGQLLYVDGGYVHLDRAIKPMGTGGHKS
ncbi:L-fucose dehydrogenase [Albibacterium indicum]|uniref:SDR family oxidoreductase n=1 Tax=Albibacterium indicum TaxID=2292082 RepID=UPI000E52CBA7|nr:SDR family oxidoreductase [Pedobacter indicus]